ncbi:MAG: STAS-like domain-containing protein [Muribaculaceae bacterium]|nr:STAS-like domain-containing protein [Muribaculaceae bacterium]
MAIWKNYYSNSISRTNNAIEIMRLDHSKAVSDFIRIVDDAIRKRGYKELTFDFSKVDAIYPNAAVPIAGILCYYQNEYDLKINIENEPGIINKTNLLEPKSFTHNNSRYILNRIWSFGTSEEVARIVNAYIEELQKSAQFYKGVLNAIEWSLNEVMDNVIQHSKTSFGYVMGQLHPSSKNIAFTVFDAGQGIYNSMKESEHCPRTPIDAITLAIKEEVTRDKRIGQGNGLFGLHSIVKQGKGKLVITSGNGSYIYNNGFVKTFDYLPYISGRTPGTIVDFQLNYSEDMSLDKALVFRGKQYKLVNLHFEDLENSYGHIIYKISERSEGTGTRESATRVKNEILNILSEEQKPITLDFTNIEVVSSSYADELLAKLFLSLGLFQFNNLIKIKGLDSSQQNILQRSVLQRIIEDLRDTKD